MTEPLTAVVTYHDLVPFIQDVYVSGSCGCCWHIVLDDENFDADSIKFCTDYAIEQNCEPCMALGRVLVLPGVTRTKLIKATYRR